MRVLKWVAGVCVVTMLAVAGLKPEIIAIGVVVLKSGRACSIAEAWSGGWRSYEMSKRRTAWENSAKLVSQENGIELWEGDNGKWWMPSISRKQIGYVFSEMDANFYGSGAGGVQKGDVVIDCGADIGVFTRQALDRGAVKVIAIEPYPDKEPCLRRNFAKEVADGRVVIVPKGVWNKDDVLEIFGDSVVDKRTEKGIAVPLTTLDKIVNELGLQRVDHIKLDIEGAEPQALEGAQQTIKRFKPRIVLATEHADDDYIQSPKQIRGYVPEYRSECEVCMTLGKGFRPVSVRMDAR